MQEQDSRYDVARTLADATSEDHKREIIGRWLDGGPLAARAFWEHVKHRPGGVLHVGSWTFVATPEQVCEVLRDPDNFRVSEYDRRMRATSGRFFLGLDGKAHACDARTGRIIPSWNHRDVAPDYARLDEVRRVAETAMRKALAAAGRRTEIARLTDRDEPCRCQLLELVAPTLDACAQVFFGVTAPSSAALLAWSKEVTNYYFRVNANDAEDRACALAASAQYRAHVMSLIAALPKTGPADALGRCVETIRAELGGVSDDDVARNLIGIITGSLTATAKAFIEGLAMFAQAKGGALKWPQLDQAAGRFPRYDAIIAKTLAGARRGSLDAVYRTYHGETRHETLDVERGQTVIVWLGGAMEHSPDHLFGVGVHKCPGMDMGKATIEGMLCALMSLPLPAAKLERIQGELHLTFDDPRALQYQGG